MVFTSPQASNDDGVAGVDSPAAVSVDTGDGAEASVGNDDVTGDIPDNGARNAPVDGIPVFLSRVYVERYVTMTSFKHWVGPCGKTQQISGNNRHLLPKNMKVDETYLRNVAKAIFYHASVPFDGEKLDAWVEAPYNMALVSSDVIYVIRNRRAHVRIADCVNKILDESRTLHAQTNMPSAWADVLRVSTINLDMYLVVTKVYPFEQEPGYNWVRDGPSGYSLRVGFFDVNHGVFYPCNEAGTSLFVGTSYRRFLYESKKRKGITNDLNMMMEKHGGMYPWVDPMGKPHYRVCEAAQIYRINRHQE